MEPPATILLIDDDPYLGDTLVDALGYHGYTVHLARTAHEGLALARAHPVQVALVDLKLPDLSGLQVLSRLKAEMPETDVVMITGYASIESAIAALNEGAFAYVQKPFQVPEILAILKKVFERRRLAREFQTVDGLLKERVAELELLLRTTQTVCAGLDLDRILHSLAGLLVERLGVALCTITLREEASGHLVVRAVCPVRPGLAQVAPGDRWELAAFPGLAMLLRGGTSGVCRRGDPPDPFSAGESAFLLPPGIASTLLVPIAANGRALGVVVLQEARDWERSPFGAEKIRLCEGMARQAALAVEQALLFEAYQAMHETTLAALVSALDARERETTAHSWRVRDYTLHLARVIGVPAAEWGDIGKGALLHDIGKIGVPDAILLKPGPLTSEEWIEMRKHPEIGYRILEGIAGLERAREIVYAHQERFDGRGYPRGLVGEAIPHGARIFAVVDAFDAITSDRPYRRAQPFSVARQEIERGSGTQFDPQVAEAFLSIPFEEWERIRSASPHRLPVKPWRP
ncbi:MAG: response regulator [Deltaproteobacteria bacterium]|nr:response regulator [Deltaproteobacteria bacterium]